MNKFIKKLILFSMSFFNDFLSYFNIGNIKNDIAISLVVGVGLMITGNIKLNNFTTNKITFSNFKKKIDVFGDKIVLSIMGKGEFVISGNIDKVEIGENDGK